MERVANIDQGYIRAMVKNSSINEEERTIEVVFATETPVRRYDWNEGRYYDEVLGVSTEEIRMDRLNTVGVLLDTHARWSNENVIGSIQKAWIEGKKCIATLKFSKVGKRAEEIWQKVLEGTLRAVSVGYSIMRYMVEEEKNSNEIPTYRAIDWEPFEISVVPVPADSSATVRSQEQRPEGLRSVPVDNKPAAQENEISTRAAMPNKSKEMEQNKHNGLTEEEVREKEKAAEKRAVESERSRVKEIREMVKKTNLSTAFAARMIDEGHSLDEVRAKVIEELSVKDPAAGQDGGRGGAPAVTRDETDKYREASSNGLLLRTGGGENLTPEQKSAAREFRNMTLIDAARHSLERSGIDTRNMTRREIATTALGMNSARSNSTSDFPIILGNTINRKLLRSYDLQERTFTGWARRETVSDFRPVTRARLGDVTGMTKVGEGEEYQTGTMGESGETYQAFKYGKIITFTWEAMINDDLSAFTRVPQAMAQKSAQLQSDLVYGVLLDNPSMSDAKALFHADHGNLAASGTAINEAGMSAARAAMRKQKSLGDGASDAGSFLNLRPRFLIVGPDKETEASKLVAVVSPNNTTDVNVFAGSMNLVVEGRITGNKWYLAADPNQIDTVEYAFLDGEPEIFTESKWGFEVDGYQMKVRTVFGAKAIDWRGLYSNPGA